MSRFKCCICGEVYWGKGRDASPYKLGRCCDNCHLVYVVPMYETEKKLRGEKDDSK